MTTETQSHTITEKEFDEKFTLVKNEVPGGACEGEYRFETFGPDLEFILKQPDRHVWTCVEGDEGWAYATGYHLVNRVYYLVTKEPWPPHLLEATLDVFEEDENGIIDEE